MHVVSHRVSEAVEKQAVSHSRVFTKHLKLFCPEARCFFWGIDQDSVEMASMKKPDKSSECVGKNTFPGMVRNICPGAWIACTVIHGFVMGTPRGLQFPCLVVSPRNWRSARWLRTWQQNCSGKQLPRDTLPLSATRFSSCPLDTWPISKALIWFQNPERATDFSVRLYHFCVIRVLCYMLDQVEWHRWHSSPSDLDLYAGVLWCMKERLWNPCPAKGGTCIFVWPPHSGTFALTLAPLTWKTRSFFSVHIRREDHCCSCLWEACKQKWG